LFEMDEKKRLRGMSAADLRKTVSRGNAQVPALPSQYTKEVLDNLLKTNIGEIKRLIKFYGSEAIDARRGYVSPSAPGIVVRG
jgi:Tfp pilus assembly PilM family ATPase